TVLASIEKDRAVADLAKSGAIRKRLEEIAAAHDDLEEFFSALQSDNPAYGYAAIRAFASFVPIGNASLKTLRAGSRVAVHAANLSVGGHVDNESGAIFVLGNLDIDGVYEDYGNRAQLYVGGSLHARALSVDGDVVVGKDAIVTSLAYAQGNDG